jgi:hypothetical protein
LIGWFFRVHFFHFNDEVKRTAKMSSEKKDLDSFERAKILEIYFLRIDGRLHDVIPQGDEALYTTDLCEIKNYLLGQASKDSVLLKVLNSTELA